MEPVELSSYLRQVATIIDTQDHPSLSEIEMLLNGAIAALDDFHPRRRKVAPPPKVPQGHWDPELHEQKAFPPDVKRTIFNRPPSVGDARWVKEQDRRMQDVDVQLEQEKKQLPEYSSFKSFIEFLNDEDRDTYTVAERQKFTQLNKITNQTFDSVLEAAGKFLVKDGLRDKIRAPDPIIEKAANLLGVTADDVKSFLKTMEDGSDLVNSQEIVEVMQEWMAS